jgi:hypothetical protein
VKPIQGDGWQLTLPDGLIATDHKADGYDGGTIARGWIEAAPPEDGIDDEVEPIVASFALV